MQGISNTLKFIIMLAVILGLAGYYVYSTFNTQSLPVDGVAVVEEDTNILGENYKEMESILENLSFDTAFLTDPTFASLENFYKRPASEEAGVPNPFTNF